MCDRSKVNKMENNVLKILEQKGKVCPEAVALKDKELSLTYQQFQVFARKAASGFMHGAGRKNPVIVISDRTVSSVVLFWSVLYSGNFYVPIDAATPAARLKLLIELIQPSAILMKEQYFQKRDWRQTAGEIPVFVYEHLIEAEEATEELGKVIEETIDADPLYMVFTSGSTGVPKGVVKTHRSVLAFVKEFVELFHFESGEVFGNQAEFDFDVSAKNIFTSVAVGGTLALMPKICFMIPAKLSEFLNEHKISVLIWSASAVKYAINARCFQSEVPQYVNKILFSGEALPAKILNAWKEYLPDAMYVNLYAPSEVTGNCLYHVVEENLENDERIPLGKAFPNMEVLILNENRKPVREGERGEIYVRGAFLASGYYDNEEKTKQAYVQNPQHNKYRDIVYRTGDLAEKKDGQIYFVSRTDDQIKHMGHRIELGEIESLASMIRGVDECGVFYDFKSEKIILVAVGQEITEKEILMDLKEKLPRYMIPGYIVIKENLAKTHHGKIDKEHLKMLYQRGEL